MLCLVSPSRQLYHSGFSPRLEHLGSQALSPHLPLKSLSETSVLLYSLLILQDGENKQSEIHLPLLIVNYCWSWTVEASFTLSSSIYWVPSVVQALSWVLGIPWWSWSLLLWCLQSKEWRQVISKVTSKLDYSWHDDKWGGCDEGC